MSTVMDTILPIPAMESSTIALQHGARVGVTAMVVQTSMEMVGPTSMIGRRSMKVNG